MKRQNRVKAEWSLNLAYAIGLIATDGNLSPDGRHINFTSKDKGLVEVFKVCLNIHNKIGRKGRGGSKEKKYFVIQFGDKNFYDFLLSIGLTPAKSKIISKLLIPKRYFNHFLRGCIDGDGNINIFHHPESKNIQLRVRLASASKKFLIWIKKEIKRSFGLKGGWIDNYKVFTLNYAKEDSLKLLRFIYPNSKIPHLRRKYSVAKRVL